MKCQNKECVHYRENFIKHCARLGMIMVTECPDYMDTKKNPPGVYMAGQIKANAWYLAKPISPGKGKLIGSFRTKRVAMTYKIEGQLMDYIVRHGKDLKVYEGIKWEIKPKVYLHSLQTVIDVLNELTSKN